MRTLQQRKLIEKVVILVATLWFKVKAHQGPIARSYNSILRAYFSALEIQTGGLNYNNTVKHHPCAY
jgi:hypothetical protein